MKSQAVTFCLFIMMSASLSSYADGGGHDQDLLGTQAPGGNPGISESGAAFEVASRVESAADKLYSNSFATFNQFSVSPEADAQSCELDGTALITIYSTNSTAQSEIDVKLDGNPVGSLTTYFQDDAPGCKTPSAAGVITLMVPAGKHTLEADSPNLTWPSHTFNVEKCGCLLLPLS